MAFARVILLLPAAAVIVPPPHAPVNPLGVDITKPDGSESLNPTPVRDWVALGLLIVKLRVVAPFRGMDDAPKASVMVGGSITLKFAEAALPAPAFVDVTALVVFVRSPADAPLTVTLNVHEPFVAKLAPVSATLLEPAVAVIVPPPQDPFRPLGVATTIPDGNVSVNATPVNPAVLAAGLATVKLRVVVPFTGIFAAPKDLVNEGGISTVRVAVAVPPLPPSFDVTTPVVLFCTPIAVPLTFTLNVHDEFTARPPPDNVTLLAPAFAVMAPLPHDPVRPLGLATTIPAGKLSVNPIPLRATVLTAGFVTVKVRVVLPLSAMEDAPNALVIVGGASTAMLADAVPPVPPSTDVTAPVVLL